LILPAKKNKTLNHKNRYPRLVFLNKIAKMSLFTMWEQGHRSSFFDLWCFNSMCQCGVYGDVTCSSCSTSYK